MIMERMLGLVESRGSAAVRYINAVEPTAAEGLVARVYEQARRDMLLAPPFLLHSPVPEILAGAWSIVRETLLTGVVDRGYKEAIATRVSALNRCPFCIDAHAMALQASRGRAQATAVESGDEEGVADPKLRDLVRWAGSMLSPGAEILSSPPFSRAEAAEIIGTAVAFHYVNRMVNIFCEDSPLPFKPPGAGMRRLLRDAGVPMIRLVVGKTPQPGQAVGMKVGAELPEDLAWAAAPPVAQAFAGFAATVDERVAQAVPPQVTEIIGEHVRGWHGEDPELGRGRLEEALAPLEQRVRPWVELGLLAALSSYRVEERLIDEVRKQGADDAALVALTAWASFHASRRVGSWLQVPAA